MSEPIIDERSQPITAQGFKAFQQKLAEEWSYFANGNGPPDLNARRQSLQKRADAIAVLKQPSLAESDPTFEEVAGIYAGMHVNKLEKAAKELEQKIVSLERRLAGTTNEIIPSPPLQGDAREAAEKQHKSMIDELGKQQQEIITYKQDTIKKHKDQYKQEKSRRIYESIPQALDLLNISQPVTEGALKKAEEEQKQLEAEFKKDWAKYQDKRKEISKNILEFPVIAANHDALEAIPPTLHKAGDEGYYGVHDKGAYGSSQQYGNIALKPKIAPGAIDTCGLSEDAPASPAYGHLYREKKGGDDLTLEPDFPDEEGSLKSDFTGHLESIQKTGIDGDSTIILQMKLRCGSDGVLADKNVSRENGWIVSSPTQGSSGRPYTCTILFDPGKEIWKASGHNAALIVRNMLADPVIKNLMFSNLDTSGTHYTPHDVIVSRLKQSCWDVRSLPQKTRTEAEAFLKSVPNLAAPIPEEMAAALAALPEEERGRTSFLIGGNSRKAAKGFGFDETAIICDWLEKNSMKQTERSK